MKTETTTTKITYCPDSNFLKLFFCMNLFGSVKIKFEGKLYNERLGTAILIPNHSDICPDPGPQSPAYCSDICPDPFPIPNFL